MKITIPPAMDHIPGATVLLGDLRESDIQAHIVSLLQGKQLDVILRCVGLVCTMESAR